MTIRYCSVCAGIEAASEAVRPLGWLAVAFSEIDKAASRVLAYRHSRTPNIGDFTTIDPVAFAATHGRVDVLFGGTPCQAFSVAGQRQSLADARGNLTLAFVDLAHGLVEHCGLRNALWENVPGVLNTPDNAFGCFLSGLVGGDDSLCPPGDGRWPRAGMVAGPRARAAWRVLDAQYFGLAQRRARVWLVVDFGDGADPATVLFERKGLLRHPPSRGEAGEGIAGTLTARAHGGGGLGTDFDCGGGLVPIHGAHGDVPLRGLRRGERPDVVADLRMVRPRAFGGGNRSGDIDVAATLTAKGQRIDFEVETFITHALTGEGFDASEDGTGRGTPLVPIAFDCKAGGIAGSLRGEGHGGGHAAIAFSCKDAGADASEDLSPTLRAMVHAGSHANAGGQMAIAFDTTQITSPLNRSRAQPDGPCHSLSAQAHPPAIASSWAVRRLTPRECERLQGFQDDHTLVPDAKGKPQADGPRYRQIGNSWPVPVAAWICARIDEILRAKAH